MLCVVGVGRRLEVALTKHFTKQGSQNKGRLGSEMKALEKREASLGPIVWLAARAGSCRERERLTGAGRGRSPCPRHTCSCPCWGGNPARRLLSLQETKARGLWCSGGGSEGLGPGQHRESRQPCFRDDGTRAQAGGGSH